MGLVPRSRISLAVAEPKTALLTPNIRLCHSPDASRHEMSEGVAGNSLDAFVLCEFDGLHELSTITLSALPDQLFNLFLCKARPLQHPLR